MCFTLVQRIFMSLEEAGIDGFMNNEWWGPSFIYITSNCVKSKTATSEPRGQA